MEEVQNPYMQFFEEISPEDAAPLKRRIRIDPNLYAYITRALSAVRNDKEVPVPANFPVPQKPLKSAIKKMARDEAVPVRFDAALNGGFIIRKATIDEDVKGENAGVRLGERRRKQ